MREQNRLPIILGLIIGLSVLFIPVAFSQDFYMLCGKGRLYYDHGNKDNFAMVVHTSYRQYKNMKKVPDYIRVKNQEYLSRRVGKQFLKKVFLEASYVIEWNNDKISIPDDWKRIADVKVKYAFQYSFKVQGKMKYYFTTVYDSVGNLLSKNMVPDRHRNSSFDSLINAPKFN